MSAEVSIAKSLSGTEVVDAVVDSFRKALMRDDRFMSHVGYTGFKAEIFFNFYPAMSFIPPVERDIKLELGDQSNLPATAERIEVEIPIRPPNQVRDEADMPTPVLVTHPDGKSEEKWVKRGKQPKQPKVPTNAVRVDASAITATA